MSFNKNKIVVIFITTILLNIFYYYIIKLKINYVNYNNAYSINGNNCYH